MNLGKLFVSFGVKTNLTKLNQFTKGVKNTTTGMNAMTGVASKLTKGIKVATAGMTAMTAVAISTTYGLKKFSDGGIQSAKSLQTFTNQTGLAISKLNQLVNVGKSVDLNLDENTITANITALEKKLARFKLGQGDYAPFQMLGVDVLGSNAFDVIKQLREQVKGLDDVMATVLIEDLGLDPNFLSILKLSNKEFDKLGKNNFLNGKEAKILNNLGLQIRKMSTEFINLRNKALVKIAPYFKQLIDKTLKWFQSNGDKVVNIISSLAKGFGAFTQAVGNAASVIIDAKGSILLLAGAVALLAIPFIPVIAGLTAIVLLLDDIATWKADGDSMLGPLYSAIAKIPNLTQILGIGAALLGVGKIVKTLSKIGGGKALAGMATNVGGSSMNKMGGFLSKAGNFGLKTLIKGKNLLGLGLATELGGELAKGLTPDKFDTAIDIVKDTMQAAALGFAVAGPVGAAAAGTAMLGYGAAKTLLSNDNDNSNSNINNNINLTVNANSSDAEGIARETNNALNNSLTQAEANISYQR